MGVDAGDARHVFVAKAAPRAPAYNAWQTLKRQNLFSAAYHRMAAAYRMFWTNISSGAKLKTSLK